MRQHEQTDQTEVVRSEPVPVPPPHDRSGRHGDRAGRTEVPEDALEDRGTFDDPTVATRDQEDRRHRDDLSHRDDQRHQDDLSHQDDQWNRDDRHRDDQRHRDVDGTDADDRGGFHRPGPVPTAFGATTVGGAVAASALANPVPAAEPDPREERTARPGDGAADARGGRVDQSADPTALLHGHHREQTTDEAEPHDHDGPGRHPHGPSAADQPSAVDHRDTGVRRDAAADAAGYGSPAAAMVDPDTAPQTGRAGATPDTLAAAGTTGSSPAALAEPAALFDAETAQGFRDRWRDVQLRFVDDPKAAAGQAQGLVEEAIQALAAALAAQKNKIGGWQDAGSADTEQLRQAVRGYRDFLDRVLGR